MVPSIDDTCSDMLAFGCSLLDACSFSDINGELGLGPRDNFSSRCGIHADTLNGRHEASKTCSYSLP